ncbi:WD40 repeat domain-containing protein [Nostoc sp. JL33]|uniref:WD40 repeat domain-containing protein n=1 Tax=Nostoc sp. JL33 TaxID=2815396 RepID=UPI0025ECC3E9|nr:WD40 repeat domain-containing protein [Nostoc sp. JL33]MBN3869946.1 WD40 repeat domain-containing protein [Nostoc sp. JL33]
MKLLNFLKSKPAITALAIAVNLTVIVIDVHSSSSNPPIGRSTITQSQSHLQLVYTLTGHKKVTFGVPAVVISPDGQTLISGGRDDTIKVWNLRSGKLLLSLDAHSDGVTSIAISPDGKRIVSGGITTPTMKVWDLRTQLMLTLNIESGHTQPVETVAISSDNRLIASGSDDHTIKLWDLHTLKLLDTITAHSEFVSKVAFSPDMQTLVSTGGSDDNTIRLISLPTKKTRHILKGHKTAVDAIAITPDSKKLVTGSFGQLVSGSRAISTLKLWNLQTGKLLHEFTDNFSSVDSLVISPNGKILICGNFDGSIKLWSLETLKLLHTFQDGSSSVLGLAISPDGKTLASSNEDSTIHIWQIN